MLESCHFFEANVNPQVLRLQISFLFHFALHLRIFLWPTWPRSSHWPVACKVKIRTMCWIGDSSSSSKNVKASVSGNVSPGSAKFSAVNRNGSFGKPSCARFLASFKHISQIGLSAQANLFSAFAQNSFFGKFAFQTSQATVIWSAWCRTILRDNTSSLEIQARSKKCRLHWHDGKKPWCGFRHLRNSRTVVANSSATWAVASDLPRLSPGYATWLHAISSAAQWLMLARVVLGHFSPSLSYPLSDSETCVAWSHNNNEVRHLLSWRALQTRIQHLLRQRIAILLFFDPGSAWTCLSNQPLEHTTMLPIPATSPSYLHQAFHSSVGKNFCQIHILAYLCAQLHA